MAVVRPAGVANDTSDTTGASAPGYRNVTWLNSTDPSEASPCTGDAGAHTELSVLRTSAIRSAHTAARGAMEATKVAIITDIRMSTK